MNVVYPLGTGSLWQNNELRYSLRSLEANFEFDEVYVIGEKPDWYKGIHIPYIDGKDRLENVFQKQRIACGLKGESFLYMNDDFFLLEPLKVAHYYCGTVGEKAEALPDRSVYKPRMMKDAHYLNFCTHSPFPINKNEWLAIMKGVVLEPGFYPRNEYANHSMLWDKIELWDSKFRKRKVEQLEAFIEGKPFFSTPSNLRWREFEPFFADLYPKKSRFEV